MLLPKKEGPGRELIRAAHLGDLVNLELSINLRGLFGITSSILGVVTGYDKDNITIDELVPNEMSAWEALMEIKEIIYNRIQKIETPEHELEFFTERVRENLVRMYKDGRIVVHKDKQYSTKLIDGYIILERTENDDTLAIGSEVEIEHSHPIFGRNSKSKGYISGVFRGFTQISNGSGWSRSTKIVKQSHNPKVTVLKEADRSGLKYMFFQGAEDYINEDFDGLDPILAEEFLRHHIGLYLSHLDPNHDYGHIIPSKIDSNLPIHYSTANYHVDLLVSQNQLDEPFSSEAEVRYFMWDQLFEEFFALPPHQLLVDYIEDNLYGHFNDEQIVQHITQLNADYLHPEVLENWDDAKPLLHQMIQFYSIPDNLDFSMNFEGQVD